jgi:toxin ParE1/3/4
LARIVWTQSAVEELTSALEYIERNSPLAAGRIADEVAEACQQLSRFPQSGRRLPERPAEGVRELILRPYRLIYRIRDEDVEILSFYHGARQLPDTLPAEGE